MILKPTAGEVLLFVLFIQARQQTFETLKTVKQNSMKVTTSSPELFP